MDVLINGRNFEITPSVRKTIEDAVNAATNHKTLTFTSARVVVELVKNCFDVSMDIHAKGHEFTAKVEDFDFNIAVDKAAAKLESQMVKVIDKINDIHHSGEKIANVTE